MKSRYKVLITTSGSGSRLGELTKFTNKSLLKVGSKPVLSYIIESYPRDTQFVVTLGHEGNQVKDFLSLVYPDTSIDYVWVDKYEGEGSSLIYSMNKAKDKLNCPFIFHAGDTIVSEKISLPETNWVGGFLNQNVSQYRSFDVNKERKVKQFYDKGVDDSDYIYIGLAGIKDYRMFWKCLTKILEESPTETALSDVHVLSDLIKKGTSLDFNEFETWLDTGNTEGLYKARTALKDKHTVLDKPGESIFFINNKVIKFFADKEIVTNRIKRSNILKNLVPNISGSKGNFYIYDYIEGELMADIANEKNFSDLLTWSNKYLWKPIPNADMKYFNALCLKFYKHKTFERVNAFQNKNKITDEENIINGNTVSPLEELLNKVDFAYICDTQPTIFHGDFILDNILKTKKGFCLIDWRQDFGGSTEYGDRYYDLSKLFHNLVINHRKVDHTDYSISIDDSKITCDITRVDRLLKCEKVLKQFILNNKLDLKKISIIRALIWLNMSPLHEHPLDLFLYYYGKLNLFLSLK